jgi:hypothetical protein
MPLPPTPDERFKEASGEIQAIVLQVLELEKEKLSQKSPRLKADIQTIIKDIITEDED